MVFPQWCEILEQKHPCTNTCNVISKEEKIRTLNLSTLKVSCGRARLYCVQIERFTNNLFTLEILLTCLTVLLSSLQANPYLLRQIVEQKVDENDPILKTAFAIAHNMRASLLVSVLFDIVSYVNLFVIVLDLCHGLYLWYNIKQSLLYVHQYFNNTPDQNVLKNILLSLYIYPLCSYGHSRYHWWNGYQGSSLLSQTLLELKEVQKQ
ncbi:hypothetical protein RFI_16115, partial [Reticulomyxa filosa]